MQYPFPYTTLPRPICLGGKKQAQEGSADLLLFPTACGVGIALARSRLRAVWGNILNTLVASTSSSSYSCWDHICQGRFILFHALPQGVLTNPQD